MQKEWQKVSDCFCYTTLVLYVGLNGGDAYDGPQYKHLSVSSLHSMSEMVNDHPMFSPL